MSFSDESLEQLFQYMRVEVTRNEEIESHIDRFIRVCCGPKEEIRNPLLKVLDCEDLLLSILRINFCSRFLKVNDAFCAEIISSLLSLSRNRDWKIIILMLKIVLESEFKEKNKIIQDVWSKQELSRMPAEMVLILLHYEPALIEKQLCQLYCKARQNDLNIWQSDSFQCWIFWCSTSADLFLIVSSILNQILLETKANSVILKIVNMFITNVTAECERKKNNILSLYPLEYQSFAASLMIEPDFNPCRNKIIKKIKFMKNEGSNALLLLLSHFPLWMNILQSL